MVVVAAVLVGFTFFDMIAMDTVQVAVAFEEGSKHEHREHGVGESQAEQASEATQPCDGDDDGGVDQCECRQGKSRIKTTNA